MSPTIAQLSAAARRAVEKMDWATLSACAAQIEQQAPEAAEGHFLRGLVEKAARRPSLAVAAFERALKLDKARYDAAVELANQYALVQRHGDAKRLLDRYEAQLANSPLYLNMAGTVHSMLGLHERAWPLYRKACELQPAVDLFQANLAACSVYMGRIDEARQTYFSLLDRFPMHQRNHFQLSRLQTARDARHVEQMQEVLRTNGQPPQKNIFLYYALGKELEDLERWDEAFHYYRLAGDTITRMANYDVSQDLRLIDTIIETCDVRWISAPPLGAATISTPIFIVGLPRTGTTLVERIISSHSQVESLDETQFLPKVLCAHSAILASDGVTAAVIESAARADIRRIGQAYVDAVAYRLAGRPFFLEKFPENFLYAGFLAKAFPQARIVYLRRHPMDACFAMYKQSFFKFAYSLENVGRYYVAHRKLLHHWRTVLGERLIEIEYEALVTDQEQQTRSLLDRLGLAFEPACLSFERNESPSATASASQVREGMHSRSIGRWRHFAQHLEPLRAELDRGGIGVD